MTKDLWRPASRLIVHPQTHVGTERAAQSPETTLHGVFAVGDVRAGSVKRVSSAVGEGAAVAPQLHAYLRELTAGAPEWLTKDSTIRAVSVRLPNLSSPKSTRAAMGKRGT